MNVPEMIIEGRMYAILSFLQDGEKWVVGYTMIERAKSMLAHLGQDDGEHLMKYQDQIPVSLRGKVVFVFTDWCTLDGVHYVYWDGDGWLHNWSRLDRPWCGSDRVFRRLK